MNSHLPPVSGWTYDVFVVQVGPTSLADLMTSPLVLSQLSVLRAPTLERTWLPVLLIGKCIRTEHMLGGKVTIHPSWINTLYLSMDANFKLKQKERGFTDPPLSNGLAYMISDATLKTHLSECISKNLTSEVCGPLIDVARTVANLTFVR